MFFASVNGSLSRFSCDHRKHPKLDNLVSSKKEGSCFHEQRLNDGFLSPLQFFLSDDECVVKRGRGSTHSAREQEITSQPGEGDASSTEWVPPLLPPHHTPPAAAIPITSVLAMLLRCKLIQLSDSLVGRLFPCVEHPVGLLSPISWARLIQKPINHLLLWSPQQLPTPA